MVFFECRCSGRFDGKQSRLIQSIPSPKAEPLKMWLAEVGRERVEETINPELTIERALETYVKKGYTREWISHRLQAIQVRKELNAVVVDMIEGAAEAADEKEQRQNDNNASLKQEKK